MPSYLLINKLYKIYNIIISYKSNPRIPLFKVLFKIINNKNDEDFIAFYTKHISSIKLKHKYLTKLSESNYEEDIYFDSFNNINDFIDKISSSHTDEYFYKEFNLLDVIKQQKEPVIINIDQKKRKKAISATVKRLVWNTHIGEEIGKTKCLCCNVTAITQLSFNCGHIIAEVNGGDTIVSNLKPICQNCNSSMATKNMDDFMKTLK